MPKPSAFDKPKGVVKADGKEYPTNMGARAYVPNKTKVSPVAPPTPGFVQRVRQEAFGSDDLDNGISAVTNPKSTVSRAVDKAEELAVSGKVK